MSIKNDGHYFCRAGGNRPDGLNEPVTVLGLLALQKKYGPERLEKACYVALHYNAPDRRFIDNLLRHHR
ncbi:hypothetical protein U9224_24200, partial [Escherichia coli]